MIKFLVILFVLIFPYTGTTQAQTLSQGTQPCCVVLQPAQNIPNVQGVALITKVKKPFLDTPDSPVRERHSVGIYADWLPLPSSLGDYDQYEGFSQLPGVISWRFKMYAVKEETPSWFGGNPWVGKFDEISLELPANTRVEVRLSNSKTQKLGPVILQNTLQGCRN